MLNEGILTNDDTVLVNRDAVVGQAGVALADGQDPASVQQGVDGCHAAKIPADLPACKRAANFVTQFMLFSGDLGI